MELDALLLVNRKRNKFLDSSLQVSLRLVLDTIGIEL